MTTEHDFLKNGYTKGIDGVWRKPRPTNTVTAVGVDPAGGDRDHGALSVVSRDVDTGLLKVDAIFLIKPSTDEGKLNKTERRFLERLRSDPSQQSIHIQAITLKLGDDCRYTPDFFSIVGTSPVFWETKGFWREDALVKIKVAARQFRWARFVAVQWKNQQWIDEDIKP